MVIDVNTVLFGIAGFVFQAIVLAVSLTWKVSLVAQELKRDCDQKADLLRDASQREFRIINEAFSAIRQKVNDVELESAKVYVRRDSWHQAMTALQNQLAAEAKALSERQLRFEEKLDGLIERLLVRPE
jgi:hypothetical protein